MDNLNVGDKVGLSWIKGNGNAKIVGIYQDYVMVLHNCFGQKPRVVYKDDIVPPEELDNQ